MVFIFGHKKVFVILWDDHEDEDGHAGHPWGQALKVQGLEGPIYLVENHLKQI